ncbi:MAG: metal-dependent hydrolase [Pyrinomonadaceae bacterium]
MPLPIAHGLLGASLVAALHPLSTRRFAAPLVLGALLAAAADLDFFLVFAFDAKAWHRGFSHSLVLGLLVTLLFALSLGKKRIREAVAFGLAFSSHGILDYLTSKVGAGIELLWPFSSARFVLGWWGLSEVPSKLPAIEILKTLLLEFVIFAPLLFLALLLRKGLRPPLK